MKVLALMLVVVAVVYAEEASCPNYRDWMPWTDKCLWFPFNQMREDMIEACDIIVDNLEQMPTFPSPPEGFPTEQCGHCSFKFRCRKREKIDGCSPIDPEVEHCHDGTKGDMCTMPKIVREGYNIGCRYAVVPFMLQQCANRPDVPEWRREQAAKFSNIIPKFHCKEDGDSCKCCCAPFVPGPDGTCVEKTEPSCEAWTDWNDWSEKCLWFPPADMKKDFKEHCEFDFGDKAKGAQALEKLKLPDGMEFPSKCGFCSFKVKCRSRPMTSTAGKKECFPLDAQKKACGNEECEGCGDVCEFPKIGDDCDYNAKMRKVLGPAIKSRMKKMPAHMRHHLLKMVMNMPHGKCVEKDGKCMCCCHPYEPNEDATQCVVKPMCKSPEEAGVNIDMNIADDAWFW